MSLVCEAARAYACRTARMIRALCSTPARFPLVWFCLVAACRWRTCTTVQPERLRSESVFSARTAMGAFPRLPQTTNSTGSQLTLHSLCMRSMSCGLVMQRGWRQRQGQDVHGMRWPGRACSAPTDWHWHGPAGSRTVRALQWLWSVPSALYHLLPPCFFFSVVLSPGVCYFVSACLCFCVCVCVGSQNVIFFFS